MRVDRLQPAQMDATRAIIEAALTVAPLAPTPEHLGRSVDLYA